MASAVKPVLVSEVRRQPRSARRYSTVSNDDYHRRCEALRINLTKQNVVAYETALGDAAGIADVSIYTDLQRIARMKKSAQKKADSRFNALRAGYTTANHIFYPLNSLGRTIEKADAERLWRVVSEKANNSGFSVPDTLREAYVEGLDELRQKLFEYETKEIHAVDSR